MKRLLLLITICISLFSFGQVPNYVPTNGLVGWWGFNGNANDESGNGNNGTVNGATLTTDRFGNPNSAYDFDGVNDDIGLGNDLSTQIEVGTIQAWIKRLSTNPIGYEDVFNKRGNYSIKIQNDEFISYQYDGGSGVTLSSGISILDTSWHHLLITFESDIQNGLKFYFDGIFISQTTWSTRDHLYPLTIGNHPPFNRWFNGKIDDCGLWSQVLTECEIQDLYNAGLNSTNGVTQTDITLTADQNNATYQWIDCDNNNSPISGETNQSYTPTVTGNYAVEVTVNGCTSVSECILVDFTGVDELLNPTTKKLIKIVNLLGQEVEYTPNTVLIYQYSDGTSEKVFTIED